MIAQSYEQPAPVGALSRDDAAKYIGVSIRMLDKYAQAGELPRVKLGAKTVYRVMDLEAFLEAKLQPVSVETKPPADSKGRSHA